MTVSVILAQKGTDVFTIGPDESLSKAANTLADRRIGALVVVGADARIEGMISERDIVRALAQRGADALSDRVSQYMARRVETGSKLDTVPEVMERMTLGKFRHMPIVEGGRLVGLVSIGDVVKHRLAEIEADATAMRDYIATA